MFLTAVALCVTNVPAQNLQTQSQSQFRNVGPQVQYPDWFSNPKITPDDRQRLMALYNLREWMAYMDSLNLASEPQIRTSDGRVLRLQPFLDVLFAVAGVSNPAASQVKSGNVREGVVIKQRAGREMDTPSAEETPNNSDIETINKEIRWYRQKKYQIPPTINAAPSTDEYIDPNDNDAMDQLGFMMQGPQYFETRPAGSWERFKQRHPDYDNLTGAAYDSRLQAEIKRTTINDYHTRCREAQATKTEQIKTEANSDAGLRQSCADIRDSDLRGWCFQFAGESHESSVKSINNEWNRQSDTYYCGRDEELSRMLDKK